jgi:hypothetical protein
MSQKHLAVIAICALSLYVGFSFMAELRASAQPDILSQHIRATAIRGETIARALDLLTSEYSIPVGIELADPKRNPDRKIDLDLPETTVKEFLDSVVSKDPRYTWKLEGPFWIRKYPTLPWLTGLIDTEFITILWTSLRSRQSSLLPT